MINENANHRSARSRMPLATALALVAIAGLVGCVGIGGERIDLRHGDLKAPARTLGGTARLATPAADSRSDTSRIGRATITVFAITSGSIRTKEPVTQEVVEEVKAALETAGYRVALSEESGARAGPVVAVEIEEFWFRNYNWIWPIVPAWGGVKLKLLVRDEGQKTVYERSFRGSGSSLCPIGRCQFGGATKAAMTKVLNEIVEACATEEFQAALREA